MWKPEGVETKAWAGFRMHAMLCEPAAAGGQGRTAWPADGSYSLGATVASPLALQSCAACASPACARETTCQFSKKKKRDYLSSLTCTDTMFLVSFCRIFSFLVFPWSCSGSFRPAGGLLLIRYMNIRSTDLYVLCVTIRCVYTY